MLAQASIIQNGVAVGIYTLRRTCPGFQTGSHCGSDECQLCPVIALHRDLTNLQSLSEVTSSSHGNYYNFINIKSSPSYLNLIKFRF